MQLVAGAVNPALGKDKRFEFLARDALNAASIKPRKIDFPVVACIGDKRYIRSVASHDSHRFLFPLGFAKRREGNPSVGPRGAGDGRHPVFCKDFH